MTVVSFVAHGLPVAQGSKVRTRHGGMRESSKRLAPWRETVATYAAQAMNGRILILGPVELTCTFFFPRPKAHYRTGTNAGELRPGAPARHAQTPDLDKTLRAICDSLTGVVLRDDAQVCSVIARKVWGEPARAVVEVREL